MNLFIATPCYGGLVTNNYALSLLGLNNALVKKNIPFSVLTLGNESLISRARNVLAAQFMADAEASHLLFIDADIRFAPEAVFRLLEHGGPVVATACPKKTIAWDQAFEQRAHCASPRDLEAAAIDYAIGVFPEGELFSHESPDRTIERGFVRTAYAGTGMMLIAREVFSVLQTRFPECRYEDEAPSCTGGLGNLRFYDFFDTLIHPESRRYLSEDYAFCHRWRSGGGEVWLDVESAVAHEGSFVFEGDIGRSLALVLSGS